MNLSRSLILLIVLPLVVSCGKSYLSDREASQLIADSLNLPRATSIIFKDIQEDSPIGQEVDRLCKEGCLVKDTGDQYKPTDKGKAFVEAAKYNSRGHSWVTFQPYTHQVEWSRILTKHIEDSGAILIEFELKCTLNIYGHQLMALDPKAVDRVLGHSSNTLTGKATLEKGDNGWHVKTISMN